MKLFRHIILALTALILASCAVDEFWEGTDYAEGEEVVMTFKPKFEDFESVTKTIGDGSQVNQLLVHVYEKGTSSFDKYTFEIERCSIKEPVKIPFYYGKKYKVYFWAYKSGDESPYTISEHGLQGGVSVNYPANELGFNALESLDAFYAVSDVDLSNGRTMDINLTRPFAQVNLVADKWELLNAQASKVEFTINVAETFNLTSPTVEEPTEEQKKTFTFTSEDNFQTTEEINGNVYLGTTYLFVPSSGKVTGKVKLYAGDNVLKSAENIEIPLVGNKRTNLVFSGFQISVPEWNPDKVKVPEGDGWITITEPEQLAALLMTGTTKNTQVRIGSTLNMEKMPQDVKNQIVGKSFSSLTLDGTGLTIKNFSAPAFFANATNLTVSNLTLENVNITAATHVGVLVNELKGNGTFTNVTVKGSSATTTNGAAGGFVGRSVRIDEKERRDTLALTFTGCRIEGTDDKKIVATGSAAEGKFVGLFSGYDNGEKLVFTDCTSENATVADYTSRYVEGNKGAWLAGKDYSAYNGFLGSETYFRGKVYFGGEDESTRFSPKWDGTTTVEPIYEDTSKKIAQIWSAFDLAYLQGKSMTTLRFKSNVDMCGICNECKEARSNPCSEALYLNTPGHKCASCPDELYHCDKCTYFTPIQTINNIYGEEHTIYNLNIQQEHNNGMSWGAGFCNKLNSGTIENLTFDGAYIKCTDIQSLRNNTQSGGNAYAGTLASRTNESASITIKNVHANNGYVTAVSKLGGMIGYVHGTLNASDCSVNNYTIENNKINVINTYEKTVSIDRLGTFSVSAEFYTEGEAGGFIGFLTSGNSIISDCHVTNAIMKCHGQDNQTKTISGKLLGFIPVFYPYNIAGRHINAFIGDIRTVNQETITITNSTATYTSPEGYDYNINSKGKGEIIGCCYIVGVAGVVGDKKGKVTVDGESMGFVGD